MTAHTGYRAFAGPLRQTPMADWIAEVLGPVTLYSWGDYRSWDARTPDGTTYTVRHLADNHAFQRELYAHQSVLGALDPASVPRLVAASHPRQAVITSALQGIPVSRTRLTRERRIRTYHSAGTLLARLHHARRPSPRALATARAALRRTADHAGRLLTLMQPSPLSDAEYVFAAEHVAHLRDTDAIEIGFIHGRFSENTWIWSTNTRRLALAQFSASHYAPVVYDLVRLACRWTDRSPERGAFFAGYGRKLSPPESTTLTSLTALHCATRIVRSHDTLAVRAKRHTLSRLMKGAQG